MSDIPKARNLPIVAVFGSGSSISEDQKKRAQDVGSYIAERGYHILTGGGAGIMEEAAKGFVAVPNRVGMSIGIIPAGKPSNKYPNAWIEIPIQTHLEGVDPISSRSRNHINVLSADVVVALPGSSGTRAELLLANRTYHRPTIAFLVGDESIGESSSSELQRDGVRVADSLDAVRQFIALTLSRFSHG